MNKCHIGFDASLLSVTLFIGAIVPLCAQVTIQKNGVGVPEGQVEILFSNLLPCYG